MPKTDTPNIDEPPPQSFTFFLNNLANGEAESHLSYEKQQLLRRLQEEAKTRNGPVKGKIKLVVSFVVNESDAVGISYDVATAAPARKTTPAACWLDKDGRLTDKNPKQQEFTGMREVGGRREYRSVDAPTTGAPREG